jgi:hypothetical protein
MIDPILAFETAALEALDEVSHEAWCAAKGRCTTCDPLDPICYALEAYGRPAAREKLDAQRADRDEWRRLALDGTSSQGGG